MAAAVTAGGWPAGYLPVMRQRERDAGLIPGPTSNELADQQLAARVAVTEAQGRHVRFVRGEGGTVAAAVCALHSPRARRGEDWRVECAGCPEDQEWGAPPWPCETWVAVDRVVTTGS